MMHFKYTIPFFRIRKSVHYMGVKDCESFEVSLRWVEIGHHYATQASLKLLILQSSVSLVLGLYVFIYGIG